MFSPSFFLSSTYRPEKSWLERFRDWDWDYMDLVRSVIDTIFYHIDSAGWIGLVAVAIVVIFLLLHIDLTAHTTSLVLARVFGGLGSIVSRITGLISEFAFVKAKDILISRTRHAVRYVKSLVSDED